MNINIPKNTSNTLMAIPIALTLVMWDTSNKTYALTQDLNSQEVSVPQITKEPTPSLELSPVLESKIRDNIVFIILEIIVDLDLEPQKRQDWPEFDVPSTTRVIEGLEGIFKQYPNVFKKVFSRQSSQSYNELTLDPSLREIFSIIRDMVGHMPQEQAMYLHGILSEK